ncbi:MAG TPA: tripartite tricarboxylate transporter substrate-binding protein [Burkholderiales bacterium]|jgi:tripartite-type tricarboxylate transporter receptor subunit TctC|nr:tripartite tricarboxylate transporter substrate-binding protein [Burkholderiales bacterium]
MKLRTYSIALSAALLMGASFVAYGQGSDSQTFPDKAITLIVPTAPGGSWDAQAQILKGPWGKALGQPVRIKYEKPELAALQGLSRHTDNYHVMIIANEFATTSLYVNHVSITMDDFYPLATLQNDRMTVFVPKNSKFHSVKDLVQAAKQQRINLGVSGITSSNGLMARILAKVAGIESNLNIIPFNGGSELRTVVAGAHVDAGISPSAGIVAFGSTIRPIGYFGNSNPASSLIHTTAIGTQLGVTIPNVGFGQALYVSAKAQSKHPKDTGRLISALNTAVKSETFKQAMQKAGYAPYFHFADAAATRKATAEMKAALDQYGKLMTR